MPVHKPASPFGGAVAGTELGPMRITVSAAANERYWASAGVDHATLRRGALYPPVAANLAILLFQTVATRPLLHTSQRLTSHATIGSKLNSSSLKTTAVQPRDSVMWDASPAAVKDFS